MLRRGAECAHGHAGSAGDPRHAGSQRCQAGHMRPSLALAHWANTRLACTNVNLTKAARCPEAQFRPVQVPLVRS